MFTETKLDKAIDTAMDFWCEWGAIILTVAFFAGVIASHSGPWIAAAVTAAAGMSVAGVAVAAAVRASR